MATCPTDCGGPSLCTRMPEYIATDTGITELDGTQAHYVRVRTAPVTSECATREEDNVPFANSEFLCSMRIDNYALVSLGGGQYCLTDGYTGTLFVTTVPNAGNGASIATRASGVDTARVLITPNGSPQLFDYDSNTVLTFGTPAGAPNSYTSLDGYSGWLAGYTQLALPDGSLTAPFGQFVWNFGAGLPGGTADPGAFVMYQQPDGNSVSLLSAATTQMQFSVVGPGATRMLSISPSTPGALNGMLTTVAATDGTVQSVYTDVAFAGASYTFNATTLEGSTLSPDLPPGMPYSGSFNGSVVMAPGSTGQAAMPQWASDRPLIVVGAMGNVVASRNSYPLETIQVDGLGRATFVGGANGSSVTLAYDNDDRVTSQTLVESGVQTLQTVVTYNPTNGLVASAYKSSFGNAAGTQCTYTGTSSECNATSGATSGFGCVATCTEYLNPTLANGVLTGGTKIDTSVETTTASAIAGFANVTQTLNTDYVNQFGGYVAGGITQMIQVNNSPSGASFTDSANALNENLSFDNWGRVLSDNANGPIGSAQAAINSYSPAGGYPQSWSSQYTPAGGTTFGSAGNQSYSGSTTYQVGGSVTAGGATLVSMGETDVWNGGAGGSVQVASQFLGNSGNYTQSITSPLSSSLNGSTSGPAFSAGVQNLVCSIGPNNSGGGGANANVCTGGTSLIGDTNGQNDVTTF
jgi:hypothetical protein